MLSLPDNPALICQILKYECLHSLKERPTEFWHYLAMLTLPHSALRLQRKYGGRLSEAGMLCLTWCANAGPQNCQCLHKGNE